MFAVAVKLGTCSVLEGELWGIFHALQLA